MQIVTDLYKINNQLINHCYLYTVNEGDILTLKVFFRITPPYSTKFSRRTKDINFLFEITLVKPS